MSDRSPEAVSLRRRLYRRIQMALLATLVLLLILLLLFLVRFYRPFGKGPAGPPVNPSPFTETWTEHPVLLLGLGDSVTAGFGVSAPYGYVARLAENPPDDWEDMKGICLKRVLPNLEVMNAAVSGSTSLQHVNYFDTRLPDSFGEQFGLVVMTTGGNDLIHNYGRTPPKEGAMYGATLEEATEWIARFRSRLDEIITRINAKFPAGCLIFLADIYDPTDGVGDAASVFLPRWPDGVAILAQYNQCIKECTEKHNNVFFVPLHDSFLGHGTHCSEPWRPHYCYSDPTYWFGVNIEDPNLRGFDATRRIFLNEIVKQRATLMSLEIKKMQ
ncbi:MAG: SGNH/GDSL hydrolase family protein [Planctomycetia bacterium]|nr:SGNH/GDSL hydrolase family protein [Planctomycetia bacterium]